MSETEDNGEISFILLIIYQARNRRSIAFAFIHSLKKYFLPRTYHGPSVILGGEETSGNKVSPSRMVVGREMQIINKCFLYIFLYEVKEEGDEKGHLGVECEDYFIEGIRKPSVMTERMSKDPKRLHSRCAQGAARSLVLPQQSEKEDKRER